jgi:hypothetical protein
MGPQMVCRSNERSTITVDVCAIKLSEPKSNASDAVRSIARPPREKDFATSSHGAVVFSIQTGKGMPGDEMDCDEESLC